MIIISSLQHYTILWHNKKFSVTCQGLEALHRTQKYVDASLSVRAPSFLVDQWYYRCSCKSSEVLSSMGVSAVLGEFCLCCTVSVRVWLIFSKVLLHYSWDWKRNKRTVYITGKTQRIWVEPNGYKKEYALNPLCT